MLTLAAIACTAVALADDFDIEVVTKERLAEYLATTGHRLAVEHWESKRQAAQRAIAEARRTRSKTQKADIERATKEMAEASDKLKEPAPFMPQLPMHRLRVGAVGVPFCPRDSIGLNEEGNRMRVRRIIDGGSFVASMGHYDKYYIEFVVFLNTHGLADGVAVPVGERCFEVTGTDRTYGKTLFVLKPLMIRP